MDYLGKTKDVFKKAVVSRASDLHLVSGEKPTIRVDDRLLKIEDEEVLDPTSIEQLVLVTMRPEYVERLKSEKEVDFSFDFDGARVRANVYFEQGRMAGAFRFISEKVRMVEELGLPPIIQEFANREQGLVIISGPTGHGKSTTIAALIEYINRNYSKHIVTVEDPIEYVFQNAKCIVNQRELGTDTLSFPRALRSVLREDPDVVFIGEMRDLETFEVALMIAETGHLVFTTLHTNNSAQTADRIIDMFPKNQQTQVRQQLSNVLAGVVSQRLLQKASGEGRLPACEIMVVNNAIASLIREGRTHQIQSVIQTSASEGMITLDKVLSDLVARGEVTLEEAMKWTSDVREFKKMVF